MKSFWDKLSDEQGSVMVIALLILVLLTIIGISATTTSQIEIQNSGNKKFHKTAFYSAEAARAYVVASPDLYGNDNITAGSYLCFPNNDDPSEDFSLCSSQSFNGEVEYLNSSAPPRGSGYQVGKFKAHNYEMRCSGTGPNNAASQIGAGFYRIGY